jgi:U2-associated protein SR140
LLIYFVQVADIIIGSLVIESTAVPRKVARLHLICDILHNSAAALPSAWKFRQEFQSRLPRVFDHLSTIYQSFPGRITAEIFKKQIISVVEIWEDWIVFPPEFTSDLRARLDGTPDEIAPAEEEKEEAPVETTPAFTSRFKSSTFKPADAQPPAGSNGQTDEDVDGMAIDDVDGEPVDLDGEPVDVDGEPLDLDGEPVEMSNEPIAE